MAITTRNYDGFKVSYKNLFDETYSDSGNFLGVHVHHDRIENQDSFVSLWTCAKNSDESTGITIRNKQDIRDLIEVLTAAL